MDALRSLGRVIVAFWILSHLSLLAYSSSPQDLQILSAERRIDLSSHIVKVFLTLKVENTGGSPVSEVLLAFPPTQVDHIASLKAALTVGKKKKKSYVPLEVNPTDLPDAPNQTKYFSISLLNPLNAGETATLEVLYILTHSLEPFPAEINQAESQLVYFRDSAIILSPYYIKQQTTFIRTPSTKVESFTRVESTNRAGTEIKYGPYKDRPAYSYSPVIVHFENNKPFAVVEELVREVEISHWGNLQITEHYRLSHAGARHKGVFSRVEYQSRPSSGGISSFKHLLARLPPRVHSVFYRDEIGNISSSHLRIDYLKSDLEIEPRYPLFGGWKATFVIGYGLPLEDFLFESPDGRRYLNFTFGCPLAETVVDKLIIKVVLPEGSKDPSAVVPFSVKQHLETKYSYLDVAGRTVVVLEKENVVPEHNSPFQVCSECVSKFQDGGSPVIAKTSLGKGGRSGISVMLSGAPNWDECSKLARIAVNWSEWSNRNSGIDCDLQPCALPDGLPHPYGKFFAISGFFVVYRFFNLTSEASLDDVLEKGREFCERTWEVAKNSVAPQPFIEQYCFRAPYIVFLLREGLHITDNHVIIGSGRITWTLGVALLEAGKALSTRLGLRTYEIFQIKINPIFFIAVLFISLLFLLCALSCVGNWMPKFFWRSYLPLFRTNGASSASVLSIPSPFRFQRWSPISPGDGRVKMPLSPTIAGGAQRRPFGLGDSLNSGGGIQLMESSLYPSTSSMSHSYSSNNLGQMQFDSSSMGSFWSPHRSQMHLQSRRSQSREDLNSSLAEAHMVKV